jgi:hypothetical protein
MLDILPGIAAVSAIVVILFFLIKLSNKAKVYKEVMFLRPRDKRGEKLDITRETDRSILCERSDPVHRFIKIGPAFVFKDGGKTSVRFFGIEGSAYTANIKNEKVLKMSIKDFLISLWTDRVYNALPSKLRDSVEADRIGVTIEPNTIDAEELGLDILSSDDVNDEGDAIVLTRLSKTGQQENVKQKMFSNLIWLALGFGLAAVLSNIGLF